jgi:hypothetical protein
MESKKNKNLRKVSVNTLFAKTLQLSALHHVPSTADVPSHQLYRSQSDMLDHGGEGDADTARRSSRGRSSRRGPSTERASTERAGHGHSRSDKDPFARNTSRSIRDMISEIETRARNGLSSPRHICQDFNTLPTECLDWHKKRKSPRRSVSPKNRLEQGSVFGGEGSLTGRPLINIIGCQQSQELILARADDRIRRQLQAVELRDEACLEQRNRILKLIADQETKAERIVLHMKRQQAQSGWLKIVAIVAFMSQIKPMVLNEMDKMGEEKKLVTAAGRITHNFVSWHQRRHAQRYLQMFKTVLASKTSFFLMRFRIIYKRLCVRRIRSFFTDIKDRNKVSSMVHNFLHSVKLIQVAIRNFIACRLEKIRSTIIIWDRLEMSYIKMRLAQRKKKLLLSKSRKVESLAMDFTTRAEMERQMKKWEAANWKMEKILSVHRRRGMLTDETAESEALQYVIPSHVKFRIVADLVKAMRREFMLSLDDVKKKASNQTSFSTSDAVSFLQRKQSVYRPGSMPEYGGEVNICIYCIVYLYIYVC